MIILIDQDGPLADETARLFEILRERYPADLSRHSGVRTQFALTDNFPAHLSEAIEEIRRSKGFYYSFPPVAGSVEAVNEMTRLGHRVYICTAPLSHYEHCIPEKYAWIERYLGSDFTMRIVPAKDKTVVRGNILIDDRPEVEGILEPEWEHVLFDASYNRHITHKRRLNWNSWKEVLGL